MARQMRLISPASNQKLVALRRDRMTMTKGPLMQLTTEEQSLSPDRIADRRQVLRLRPHGTPLKRSRVFAY